MFAAFFVLCFCFDAFTPLCCCCLRIVNHKRIAINSYNDISICNCNISICQYSNNCIVCVFPFASTYSSRHVLKRIPIYGSIHQSTTALVNNIGSETLQTWREVTFQLCVLKRIDLFCSLRMTWIIYKCIFSSDFAKTIKFIYVYFPLKIIIMNFTALKADKYWC